MKLYLHKVAVFSRPITLFMAENKIDAEVFDSPAYPKDLKKRARVNEAMDWLNTGFYREYGYHLIYPNPCRPGIRSMPPLTNSRRR